MPKTYADLKIAKQRIIFAPAHYFDNKIEIMSSRMYRIISTSRYVMPVSNVLFSNVLFSNAVINMFSI